MTTGTKTGGRSQETTYQRNDEDTTTTSPGPLSSGWEDLGDARINYVAYWYDDIGRVETIANYGTYGGAALDYLPGDGAKSTYAEGPPACNNSDNVIVTHHAYDNYGRRDLTTNNRGKKTKLFFDDRSRTKHVVENYLSGSGHWVDEIGPDGGLVETGRTSDPDANRITSYTYNIFDQVLTQKAVDPELDGDEAGHTDDDQETAYTYSTGSTDDCPVPRKDIVVKIVYPDGDTSTDNVQLTYYANGAVKTRKDQRGTVHTYTYDIAGRLTDDAVTTLGGADGYVDKISRTYDAHGRMGKITSVNTGTPETMNEVEFTYGSWGNLTESEQEHDGAVSSSPQVTYHFNERTSPTGSGKNLRLDYVDYPNSRRVWYNCPADSTIGGRLNRLANIASVQDTSTNSEKFAEYTYLGAGTVVEVGHPAVTNNLKLTRLEAGANSDPYGTLDQFGRVVDQWWKTSILDWDRYEYGYDRNSNRMYRKNMRKADFSELYHANGSSNGYDGLDRLKEFRRGTLVDTANIAPTTRRQIFTLDQVGNWPDFKNDAGAGGTGQWDLEQTRGSNTANEITSIGRTAGADWIDPAHDPAGNLTLAPRPGDEATNTEGLLCVYDAWKRLVAVWQDNGGGSANGTLTTTGEDKDTLLAEYRYDGLHRRIAKLLPNDNNWDRTDYYFTISWQVVEERVATDVTTANRDNPATEPTFQYVWDIRYIDAPVLRDENIDPDSDDTCDDGDPDERLYYCNDANFNVTALVGTDGIPVERYVYDPYGKMTIYNLGWSSTVAWDDSKKNEILYCGYRFDPETGLYHVRHRHYHPTLGRWLQRDLEGYIDGMSLYEYVLSSPPGFVDWSGAQAATTTLPPMPAPTTEPVGYWVPTPFQAPTPYGLPRPGPWTWRPGLRPPPLPRTIPNPSGVLRQGRRRGSAILRVPSFSPSPGLSGSVAYYAPVVPPFGVYIKLTGTVKRGKCCEGPKERHYAERGVTVDGGGYVGSPGFKAKITAPVVEFKKQCPAKEGWGCKGGVKVSLRLSVLCASCTWTYGSGWDCGLGIRFSWDDVLTARPTVGGFVRCDDVKVSDSPIP